MLDECCGVVGGGIVYNDDSVVAIVLIENGLEVVLIPEILRIIKAGDYDTEGQLCRIVAVVVGLLETSILFLELLLDLVALDGVDEGSLDVGPLHHPRIALLLRLEVFSLNQLIEFIVFSAPDNLLRIIFEEVDEDCLLPDDSFHFLNPLSYGHLILRFFLRLENVFVSILQQSLKILDPLAELREELSFDLVVLGLFLANFFVNASYF
jgi:hypothetical protein